MRNLSAAVRFHDTKCVDRAPLCGMQAVRDENDAIRDETDDAIRDENDVWTAYHRSWNYHPVIWL